MKKILMGLALISSLVVGSVFADIIPVPVCQNGQWQLPAASGWTITYDEVGGFKPCTSDQQLRTDIVTAASGPLNTKFKVTLVAYYLISNPNPSSDNAVIWAKDSQVIADTAGSNAWRSTITPESVNCGGSEKIGPREQCPVKSIY